MILQKYIIELANEFNLSTREIESYWFAFSSINRVGNITSYTQLNATISEVSVGNGYEYHELPIKLKDMARKAIETNKSLMNFYGDLNSKENLRKFIKKLTSEGIHPSEYYIKGILTYRKLQRGDNANHLKGATEIIYEKQDKRIFKK